MLSNNDLQLYLRIADATTTIGTHILRYGLVLILLMIGTMKFFTFEAAAIRPMVETSPVLSWLYKISTEQGVSNFFGVFEIIAAILIAIYPWAPGLSALGSFMTVPMFIVTLSFLFTTPGALSPQSDIAGFLIKDLILLGAGLYTAGQAMKVQYPS